VDLPKQGSPRFPCDVLSKCFVGVDVEVGGSFFPTKASYVFDEENGLSALKIVIGFLDSFVIRLVSVYECLLLYNLS